MVWKNIVLWAFLFPNAEYVFVKYNREGSLEMYKTDIYKQLVKMKTTNLTTRITPLRPSQDIGKVAQWNKGDQGSNLCHENCHMYAWKMKANSCLFI